MSYPKSRASGVMLLVLGLVFVGNTAFAEFVNLHSGNGPANSPDPLISVLIGSGGAPLSAAPFTTSDFAAACGGQNAMVVVPISVWAQGLPCDPNAQWVGIDMYSTPASALYCQGFDVETCCIESATLNFCWVTDDGLGDALYGGSNPAGVYLNGIAVSPSIDGGNYGTETFSGPIDVTSLVHCGGNELQVYNRDAGYVVSGVMYSATIDIIECSTATEEASWSLVKPLYR